MQNLKNHKKGLNLRLFSKGAILILLKTKKLKFGAFMCVFLIFANNSHALESKVLKNEAIQTRAKSDLYLQALAMDINRGERALLESTHAQKNTRLNDKLAKQSNARTLDLKRAREACALLLDMDLRALDSAKLTKALILNRKCASLMRLQFKRSF